jgi:hypothetical protein
VTRNLLATLVLVACSTERTFDMTWSLTSTGACTGAGIDPSYATQQEVTLRYVKAPNHFNVLCSNKLASALTTAGKPVISMTERRNADAVHSTSICAIAGMRDDAPNTTCTFAGQVRAGYNDTASPGPWD